MKNPPAFPLQTDYSTQEGMTLRDYFAAKAMQGWLASFTSEEAAKVDIKDTSKFSYELADAMLEAREK